ncbi:hypothetical protein PAPHI01_2658 [Pancytospora philotis]|nr:hypothetical protein PAPHI01_2658 [Pancytospora philotis]
MWVLGMVECIPERRLILVGIENRAEEMLMREMKRFIHPVSTIYSNCW